MPVCSTVSSSGLTGQPGVIIDNGKNSFVAYSNNDTVKQQYGDNS